MTAFTAWCCGGSGGGWPGCGRAGLSLRRPPAAAPAPGRESGAMSHHSNPKHSIQLSWPAFILFLLLAAAIGAAGGYFAYRARQQAVAEHRG